MADHSIVPVVLLTGGIGCGKSSVARWLAKRERIAVIDGDRLGHEVLTHQAVKEQIYERFGDEVFDAHGRVDRRELANRVFGTGELHSAARADLESIVHPGIATRINKTIKSVKRKGDVNAILLDAAVALESGWNKDCDAVVFIDVPERERVRRVKETRGWTEGELKAREASQWSLDRKRSTADYIIDNGGDLEVAGQSLQSILQIITNRTL